jgi:hypothetical protein
MSELIVCTAKYALLPEDDHPTPATIVVDQISGKIIEIERKHLSKSQFQSTHASSTISSWIDAGEQIVIPGLVECVLLFPASPDSNLGSDVLPAVLMFISMNPVALLGKASGRVLEPQQQVV